jgi:hypothetical protein
MSNIEVPFHNLSLEVASWLAAATDEAALSDRMRSSSAGGLGARANTAIVAITDAE